jgi:hypothetical protein
MDSTSDTLSQPETDGASLPPPARTGARLRLAALLLLGLGCLLSAWLLRGSAAYALLDVGPHDVGQFSHAKLDGGSVRGSWVKGSGKLEGDALTFQRRGERGSLVLARMAGRPDLWVLLRIAPGTPHYVPPRVLEGRLLARQAMGLRLLPVSRLMQARGSKLGDYLLVVGSRPAEHRTDLLLLLLLTMFGLIASVRFVLLALPVPCAQNAR